MKLEDSSVKVIIYPRVPTWTAWVLKGFLEEYMDCSPCTHPLIISVWARSFFPGRMGNAPGLFSPPLAGAPGALVNPQIALAGWFPKEWGRSISHRAVWFLQVAVHEYIHYERFRDNLRQGEHWVSRKAVEITDAYCDRIPYWLSCQRAARAGFNTDLSSEVW